MENLHLYEKRVVLSLAVILLVFATGCKREEYRKDNISSASETMSEQVTTQEVTTALKEKLTEPEEQESRKPTEKEDVVADEIITTTEHSEDGSISMVSVNSLGQEIVRIYYDATDNITTKNIYEYNKRGELASEKEYKGPGNLIEEFNADNYEHATEIGEQNYDLQNDYDVDVDHAFDVTIEELAPLYKRAEKIKEDSGVVVLIADKVSNYTAEAEQCHEYDKIEVGLDFIEACIECYPANFFRDFSDEDTTTTVCIQLVGSGGAPGIYLGGYEYRLVQIDLNDYTAGDEADTGAFFNYTFHHEIFHMISDKLQERATESECPLTEEKWSTYNPDGFEYANYDDSIENDVYLKDDNSEYFVYSYGCAAPDEDRAIIFGYAMSYYQGYEDENFSFNDKVDAKLEYLCNCIRAGFESEDWPDKMPWEYILDV